MKTFTLPLLLFIAASFLIISPFKSVAQIATKNIPKHKVANVYTGDNAMYTLNKHSFKAEKACVDHFVFEKKQLETSATHKIYRNDMFSCKDIANCKVHKHEPLVSKSNKTSTYSFPIIKKETIQDIEPDCFYTQQLGDNSVYVEFYSMGLTFYYDEKILKELKDIDAESIRSFWMLLYDTVMDTEFLPQIWDYAQQMELVNYEQVGNEYKGDWTSWGYCILIHKIGQQLYPSNLNAQKVFTCFMLNQSGIACKIAKHENRLYLLLSTNYEIYSTKYLKLDQKIDGNVYYLHNFDNEEDLAHIQEVSTYSLKHYNANKQINLASKLPKIAPNYIEKTYCFDKGNPKATVNTSMLPYYAELPATKIEVYSKIALPANGDCRLISELSNMMEEHKAFEEEDRINFLLNFMQNAFEQEDDTRPFCAEETLYRSHSDCEDRSILFALLVNQIIGLDVIGLEYDNHVATAVEWKKGMALDTKKMHTLNHKGKTYIACDPTKSGSTYGQMCSTIWAKELLKVTNFEKANNPCIHP